MSSVNWQRSIDQIILTGTGGDDRILGVTSIKHGAGVSLISRSLARTLAADRLRVLLLDLSGASAVFSKEADNAAAPDLVREHIVPSDQGYDVLVARAGGPSESALVDLPSLRELLKTELVEYACIVVDIPPVLNEFALGVNSVAAGAMCDRLLLVTRMGHDKRAEMTEVMSLLGGAGIRPSALLANEFK